jgi:hypothetical protein
MAMNWFQNTSSVRLRGLHFSGRLGGWRSRLPWHLHPRTNGPGHWTVDPEVLSLAFFALLVAVTFIV